MRRDGADDARAAPQIIRRILKSFAVTPGYGFSRCVYPFAFGSRWAGLKAGEQSHKCAAGPAAALHEEHVRADEQSRERDPDRPRAPASCKKRIKP